MDLIDGIESVFEVLKAAPAVLAIGLFGWLCVSAVHDLNKQREELTRNPQTVSGKPLSISPYKISIGKTSYYGLSGSMEDETGKKILINTMKNPIFCKPSEENDLAALIQPEINNGDKGRIKVLGKYDGSHFQFYGVEVEGNKYVCGRKW